MTREQIVGAWMSSMHDVEWARLANLADLERFVAAVRDVPEPTVDDWPATRATLRDDEPDLERCPNCGGPADNGFDRSWPHPNPYWCTRCERA